jgi:uncharacterized protein YbjT (DUF2867 family)
MPSTTARVLVAGATGRTGRHVVAAATARGLTPVALARDEARAREVLPGVEILTGDLEDGDSLVEAVRDVGAVIFAHGSDADSRHDAVQRIDYGGVANTLKALGYRRPRIVLQTTLFVIRRDNDLNAGAHALDWKRRSERLVRLSRAPYTIVRPGWLDNGPAGQHVTIEQGDTGEGSITREVLGAVHIEALLRDSAAGKTFEVFSGPGDTTSDWDSLFGTAQPDAAGALDAIQDTANMPLHSEPRAVRSDLAQLRTP